MEDLNVLGATALAMILIRRNLEATSVIEPGSKPGSKPQNSPCGPNSETNASLTVEADPEPKKRKSSSIPETMTEPKLSFVYLGMKKRDEGQDAPWVS
jgi:hypothetical protein